MRTKKHVRVDLVLTSLKVGGTGILGVRRDSP